MPIYEYKCSTCQRTIEQLQKMSDPDILKFEGCTLETADCELHRIMSTCKSRANGFIKEYGPPTPQSPVGQTITRDWMDLNGKITPMKEGEWNQSYVGKNA